MRLLFMFSIKSIDYVNVLSISNESNQGVPLEKSGLNFQLGLYVFR